MWNEEEYLQRALNAAIELGEAEKAKYLSLQADAIDEKTVTVLLDEAALAEALAQGTIAGAALDVLSTEPPAVDHPLLHSDLPNLLITPHVAWASRQAIQRLVVQLSENLRAFMAQQPIRQV